MCTYTAMTTNAVSTAVSYSDRTDGCYPNSNYPYYSDNTTYLGRSWTLTTVPAWTFTYPPVTESKKLIPKFHCIYCGTKDFEGDSKHTPHCPNCGALMRESDES